ncbi:hypothetical protein [Kribbella pittospori]|uniref:hypothetical protein n=1 Tax=Kribbella pittospori TaxID=722689 RepID=UPI001EDF7682|nr:hypothetical protein [Kribbella pittospori]
MLRDVREYIDRLNIAGHHIGDDHDDDPVLLNPDGRAVDTWRENYPYDERMPREEYDEAKYLLQVELLKFQNWASDTGTSSDGSRVRCASRRSGEARPRLRPGPRVRP